MQRQIGTMHSDQVMIDRIVNVIDDIAAGELSMSSEHQRLLPLPLSDAMTRLVGTVRARINAASSVTERDDLTSLLSMSTFQHIATERLARADRCHAVLLVDLNNFKHVNDTRGYAAGDQLLTLAAARTTSILDARHLKFGGRAAPPLVGRLGSDTFIVLIDIETIDDAERCARDVLSALREPFFVSSRGLLIGASIGISMSPDHGCHYDHLLRHADLAINQAKALGHNHIATFETRMVEQAHRRAALENALREALLEEQFELYFQPQVRVDHVTTPPTVEALIRWHHPEHGIILPGDFIPLAEESGLICDLGRWVLSNAIKAIARWDGAGLPCKVAVNICTQDLMNHDFVNFTREWLARTGARADALEIEVTESSIMMADETAFDHLTQLHAMGVSLAIDDFGTGYSNFARLAHLPFDRLKIDRSLTRDVLTKPTQREVITCIVQLGKALGHDVVIEGVETEAQATLFQAMGCNVLQGFHLSRPLPEAALLQWLRRAPALIKHEAA